jgi:hypothetical protein
MTAARTVAHGWRDLGVMMLQEDLRKGARTWREVAAISSHNDADLQSDCGQRFQQPLDPLF